MSASPMARQVTETRVIPTKRVQINDPSELPAHYSSTPGGTLYSTTPGGTRLVYEKSFLMNLRNSPISKTPPNFSIPNNMQKGAKISPPPKNNNSTRACNVRKSPAKPKDSPKAVHDDDQFQIEL